MSHVSIGSALTSSFNNADVFTAKEYARVCPTRIRCTCATFGCKIEGIDSAYFAKHFYEKTKKTQPRCTIISFFKPQRSLKIGNADWET